MPQAWKMLAWIAAQSDFALDPDARSQDLVLAFLFLALQDGRENDMSHVDGFDKATLNQVDDRTLQLLLNALRDLQFGQVTAIVQDGVVVQIERTEKRRMSRKAQSD
jgi:hypothetical protein